MCKPFLPTLAISFFLLVGCRVDPMQSAAGNYAADSRRIELPDIPVPQVEDRLRQMFGSMSLKLLPNGTGTLNVVTSIPGTWKLRDDTIVFSPRDQGVMERLSLGNSFEFQKQSGGNEIRWEPSVPFGRVVVIFRKTS